MTFFSLYKQQVLPHLTSYADIDQPTYPWIANPRVGLHRPAWDVIKETPSVDLLPDNPLQKSPYREGGYAMWDFIAKNARTNMRRALSDRDPVPVDQLTPTRGGFNQQWMSYMASRYLSHADDDTGYIIDMLKEPHIGARILDVAHAITHMRADKHIAKTDFWSQYMTLSQGFLQAIAEVSFAKSMLLPINLFADDPAEVLPYGIRVVPSTRVGFSVRKPYLQVPYSKYTEPDKTLIFACVAVDIGTDPVSVSMGTQGVDKDHDCWSYQPRRTYVVGWETAAWAYSQDLCRTERVGWSKPEERISFTMTGADLLPPTVLHKYLRLATDELGAPGKEYIHINEWLEGKVEQMNRLEACTQTLPCRSCLLFNHQAHEGIRAAPYQWYSPKGYKYTPHKVLHEMKVYETALRKSMRLVESAKAKKYGKGYRPYRSSRKAAHTAAYKVRRKAEKERLKKRRNR